MDKQALTAILAKTLADRAISRAERQALTQVLEDIDPRADEITVLQAEVFGLARAAIDLHRHREILDWAESVLKLLVARLKPAPAATRAEALFSPGDACVGRLRGLFADARQSVDVCVYTITDDRLCEAILATHRRGVAVRIITDIEKSEDLGSDVATMRQAGIRVVLDTSDKFMHHKFALFDRRIVVTGSYNWTRGAAEHNEENLVVSDDPRLVTAFSGAFESLWSRFA